MIAYIIYIKNQNKEKICATNVACASAYKVFVVFYYNFF